MTPDQSPVTTYPASVRKTPRTPRSRTTTLAQTLSPPTPHDCHPCSDRPAECVLLPPRSDARSLRFTLSIHSRSSEGRATLVTANEMIYNAEQNFRLVVSSMVELVQSTRGWTMADVALCWSSDHLDLPSTLLDVRVGLVYLAGWLSLDADQSVHLVCRSRK